MPVSLGDSIVNMNEHTLAELSLPIYASVNENFHPGDFDPPPDRVVLPLSAYDSASQPISSAVPPSSESGAPSQQSTSFTMLTDAGSTSSFRVSNRIQMVEKLFDMLSTSTGVDHPMCSECCDVVIEGLQRELVDVRHQVSLYRRFIDSLTDRDHGQEDPANADSSIDAELEQLAVEESELLGELSRLKVEEADLQQQLEAQQLECDQLQEEEDQHWRRYCCYRRELIAADDQYRSLSNQLEYTTRELEKLKKSNVFNATFHIWHSGHFGTINNFRLGRLPSVPVDWWEINAAWGQTALLINALARKIDLKFTKYTILPFGSHTVLKSLSDGKELPLYGDGGFKFIWNPKFDAAMVAFLECLQELQEKIEAGGDRFRLPYRVSKGRVEDCQSGTSYSIKIQLNSEEHWTKALKYMLTNLKWAVAWVCADSSPTPEHPASP